MFHTTRRLWLGFWLGIAVAAQSGDLHAQENKYEPIFHAMAESSEECIDVELRAGVLQAFPSYQHLEQLDFLHRLDRVPVGQPAILRQLGSEPELIGEPTKDASLTTFLEACVSQPNFAGLTAHAPKEGGGDKWFFHVEFERAAPLVFTAGKFTLTLTPDTLRHVSVNRKYSPAVPGATRLVVVVHEPHWSRLGQFHMIDALRELIPEPRREPVIFLVEGDYWGEDRRISLTPWNKIIGQGPDHEVEIRQLVYDYVIEGVFATRLLRSNDDIPSYAIDDQALLAKSPRMPDPQKLKAAIEKLKLPEAEGTVFGALVDGVAHIRESSKYDELIEALDEEIASTSGAKRDMLISVKSLVQAYRCAARRDATMVRQIQRRMAEHQDAIPYIFIGNFHTENILAQIRKTQPKTQFIVLDTRGFLEGSGDVEAFQDRMFMAEDGGSEGRKLAVTPRPTEQKRIRQQTGSIRLRIEQLRHNMEDDPKFGDALKRVPVLFAAELNSGWKSPPPPPPPPRYGHAFAAFEPDSSRFGGKLFFYGRDSEGWAEPGAKQSRLAAIAWLMRETPSFDPDIRCQKVKIDNREFVIFGDRDKRRYYFTERARPGNLLEVLLGPKSEKERQDMDGRLQQITSKENASSLLRKAA